MSCLQPRCTGSLCSHSLPPEPGTFVWKDKPGVSEAAPGPGLPGGLCRQRVKPNTGVRPGGGGGVSLAAARAQPTAAGAPPGGGSFSNPHSCDLRRGAYFRENQNAAWLLHKGHGWGWGWTPENGKKMASLGAGDLAQ